MADCPPWVATMVEGIMGSVVTLLALWLREKRMREKEGG